jgi:hypothetical protein
MKKSPYLLRTVVVCALVFASVGLAGCGGADKKSLSLSGKVTYKGQPVTGGTVKLTPTDGKTPAVDAKINGTGTYLIVPPTVGEMKVTIETESVRGKTGRAYDYVPPGGKAPEIDTSNLPKYVRIPYKYANPSTSDLKVSIQKGKNEQDFQLAD